MSAPWCSISIVALSLERHSQGSRPTPVLRASQGAYRLSIESWLSLSTSHREPTVDTPARRHQQHMRHCSASAAASAAHAPLLRQCGVPHHWIPAHIVALSHCSRAAPQLESLVCDACCLPLRGCRRPWARNIAWQAAPARRGESFQPSCMHRKVGAQGIAEAPGGHGRAKINLARIVGQQPRC